LVLDGMLDTIALMFDTAQRVGKPRK